MHVSPDAIRDCPEHNAVLCLHRNERHPLWVDKDMTDVPQYWDDLPMYEAQGRESFRQVREQATSVHQQLRNLRLLGLGELDARDFARESITEQELAESLRRDVAQAILKARMLTSFYEVLQLRLLRLTYQDGSQDVPSEGIHNPAP